MHLALSLSQLLAWSPHVGCGWSSGVSRSEPCDASGGNGDTFAKPSCGTSPLAERCERDTLRAGSERACVRAPEYPADSGPVRALRLLAVSPRRSLTSSLGAEGACSLARSLGAAASCSLGRLLGTAASCSLGRSLGVEAAASCICARNAHASSSSHRLVQTLSISTSSASRSGECCRSTWWLACCNSELSPSGPQTSPGADAASRPLFATLVSSALAEASLKESPICSASASPMGSTAVCWSRSDTPAS
mmetsp:Transcript_44952/g.85936  ORF Transcript_44952/g.85936 Transcript_44952/m.85936 type:complete len:250 (+) Transcript_44952:1333-2082(+)